MKELELSEAPGRLSLAYRGQKLFDYVYLPPLPQWECPKPYFHPLNTLAGKVLTAERPEGQPFHQGLRMTFTWVSGQNFWGGTSFVKGSPAPWGYEDLDNQGAIAHQQWAEKRCDDAGLSLKEDLHWITKAGQTLLHERRRIAVTRLDAEAGFWVLDLGIELLNVAGKRLEIGSPTTNGRPLAGYGGLAWRGPDALQGPGAQVLAEGLAGHSAIMGRRSPWLAYQAGGATLLFIDRPGNPRYPNPWFVRTEPPMVCYSFMFDEVYPLEVGARLQLNYKIVVADGLWNEEQIHAQL